MPKTAITSTDLQAHLDEQLGFLERSAAAFDQGSKTRPRGWRSRCVFFFMRRRNRTRSWCNSGVDTVRS